MPLADIHLMLVSEQAAPNVLPALDAALKPVEAVLCTTAKMAERAADLEPVLRESGVKVSRLSLSNEHDFAKMQDELLSFAAQRDGELIAVNLTGGTKLMALAAQSVAKIAGWRVFYVDVDTDEVSWLDEQVARHALAHQARLRHYLRAYGFQIDGGIERPQPLQRQSDLLRTLIVQVGSLESPLSQLNWLAQQAEDARRLHVDLTPALSDSRSLDTLLRQFAEAGVLQLSGNRISFASEAERTFAKGGWLEEHVFRVITQVTGELGLRDKAAGLQVIDRSGAKNELDVSFLARNRLHVIECKTARMDRPEAPKANDALFKLAEISRRVGGLGTRAMLASYRAVGESERRLAKALRVELVCGPELARLPERIHTWVKR